MHDESPTARALMALEAIQDHPGISAVRLAARLGISDRAARRYVAILCEAGVPVESTRGPYGGYRLGRGHRVPPLMFSTAEALALVMGVLEGEHAAAGDDDPVATALGKLVRVLPTAVADPVDAVRRRVAARGPGPAHTNPDPEITAVLVWASGEGHRLRLDYRLGEATREMDVDPVVGRGAPRPVVPALLVAHPR